MSVNPNHGQFSDSPARNMNERQHDNPAVRESRDSDQITQAQGYRADATSLQSSLSHGNLRERTASTSYNTARQPINDAVSSAFNTTDSSISPDLINQITEQITQNVIQRLGVRPVHVPTDQQPPVPAAINQAEHDSSAESPIIDRNLMYTPPSPQSINTEPAFLRSPTRMPTAIYLGAHAGQTPERRRDSSPFSHGSNGPKSGNESEMDDRPRRPDMSRRITTDGDATVLEKCWGKFFDKYGESTPRMEQFLRGIALHLIEDYEPRHSLVISPAKMQQYYRETRTESHEEQYPWQQIFDDNTSKISRLFREFGIEHHLIQRPGHVHERPDMPGLTPDGFVTWMTLLIRAHPDEEFERLSVTVRDMPINNPEDKTERYPKSLSRRLLPQKGDRALHERLCDRMNEHCQVSVQVRRLSAAESDSNYQPPTVTDESEEMTHSTCAASQSSIIAAPAQDGSIPPSTGSSTVHSHGVHRNLVSKTSSLASTEDDTSDMPTPQPERKPRQTPLERERKPYGSSSTGGRSFDFVSSIPDDRSNTSAIPTLEKESGRTRRRKSVSERIERNARSKPRVHQPDSGRTRDLAESSSMYRTRSNSSYEPDAPTTSRRTRANSVYDGGDKYHRRKKSPSQIPDLPRRSDTATGYGQGYTTSGPQYSYYPPPPDRYDHRSHHQEYAPRSERHERTRDNTTEMRSQHPDDHHRDGPPKDGYAPYPPSAYRDTR